MITPYQAMRNINDNLFEDEEETADALAEYDPDAAKLVREAARNLHTARRAGRRD